jgi:hypothetical protein
MSEWDGSITDIQVVTGLRRGGGAAEVTLRNGLVLHLADDHPDRDLLLQEAERSLQRQEPIGVVATADCRLVDLNYTYPVTVRFVKEDEEDGSRLMIGFWGFSPICYLTRNHPGLERIRTTLVGAAQSGAPVRLANRLWPVEGKTEVWQQVLDVRPISVPSTPLPFTGAPLTRADGALSREAPAAERGR